MRIPHRLLIGQMQRDVSATDGSWPPVAGVKTANGSAVGERYSQRWRWFRLTGDVIHIAQETLLAV
jgi:hypothetical protein